MKKIANNDAVSVPEWYVMVSAYIFGKGMHNRNRLKYVILRKNTNNSVIPI